MYKSDPMFDPHSPETALLELELQCPELSRQELVAAVRAEAHDEAEFAATLNALLDDHEFWRDDEEAEPFLN